MRNIIVYKGGTEGFANSGNEPYSEYYACQIAKAMGLNAVEYDLENWKGILASKCKIFTDIDTSFISIGRIVKSGGIKGCLDYYESLGTDFSESLKSMLIFDAVIYNEDRHFGKFGVLRDNHTGKIISPAPIFDNGFSLFNYALDNDIKDLDSYAKTRLILMVYLTRAFAPRLWELSRKISLENSLILNSQGTKASICLRNA